MNMMDTKMVKQVIEFQKAAFDNTFNVISMLQDQTEKTFHTFLEGGMSPMPEEGKKILNEWTESFKKGREEFKKVMDDGFKRVENYFARENAKTG
ncbi:MAG: hypothetical protein EHM36_13795 [Deltaproteobacteria bacterium]|nr:MAG: hypothetical protein EHM36_13795 [Deltaproteobacteria bacterium]